MSGYEFGATYAEAEREFRYAQLAATVRPPVGKLVCLHDHRFAGPDAPGPISGELFVRFHAQLIDAGDELKHALDKLDGDWWSVSMLLAPLGEQLDEVLSEHRRHFSAKAVKPLMLGIAETMDSLLRVLELRKFTLGAAASPNDAWPPEGAEKTFAEGQRFGWGGNKPILSWALRCKDFDGPGAALNMLRKLSAAVDSIAAWISENRHGVDELPSSAAPSPRMASASSASERGFVVEPVEAGAADPALAYVEDGQEFEAALAAAAPRNGARQLVQLIKPPIVEEVEHILRRKPRTVISKGAK